MVLESRDTAKRDAVLDGLCRRLDIPPALLPTLPTGEVLTMLREEIATRIAPEKLGPTLHAYVQRHYEAL